MFGADVDDVRARLKADRALMVWKPAAPLALGLAVVAVAAYAVSVQAGSPMGAALLNVSRTCLAASACLIIAAEWQLRFPKDTPSDTDILNAQSLFSVAVLATVIAVGIVATELRAQWLFRDRVLVPLVWSYGFVAVGWAFFRMATTTAALVREGAAAAEHLRANERDAQLAHTKTLQYKSSPDLMLRALSALATQADVSPEASEKGVLALATYLRESQARDSHAALPVAEEAALARAYVSIFTATGLLREPTWDIAPDSESALIPNGGLRVLVDQAIARCLTCPQEAAIVIRIVIARTRLQIKVSDTVPSEASGTEESPGLATLRQRVGAPRLQRVRFLTHTMLDVEAAPAGTTQVLSIQLETAG